jgi:YesN/AraC family two-component response regulator
MQSFENQEPEDPVIKRITKNPRLLTLINILSSEANFPKTSREILLRGYLFTIFGELVERMTFKSVRSDEGRALRSIVKFCSKHFKQEISLSILSEKLHLSKYYISHLFSGKLGIRFNDYINSLRVRSAAEMLKSGNKTITEIAYAVGYNSVRTFDRCFLKVRGMTPKEYRANAHSKK